jgi:hypothetical protein
MAMGDGGSKRRDKRDLPFQGVTSWTRYAMSEHPTTSWQAMQGGSVFYRRQPLYSVNGKLRNLSDYILAGCKFGGPIGTSRTFCEFVPYVEHESIAMMRDNTKLIAFGRPTPGFARSQVQVYSSAGEGLLLFSVDLLLACALRTWLKCFPVGPRKDYTLWMDR